jgi:hypothetical protein
MPLSALPLPSQCSDRPMALPPEPAAIATRGRRRGGAERSRRRDSLFHLDPGAIGAGQLRGRGVASALVGGGGDGARLPTVLGRIPRGHPSALSLPPPPWTVRRGARIREATEGKRGGRTSSLAYHGPGPPAPLQPRQPALVEAAASEGSLQSLQRLTIEYDHQGDQDAGQRELLADMLESGMLPSLRQATIRTTSTRNIRALASCPTIQSLNLLSETFSAENWAAL